MSEALSEELPHPGSAVVPDAMDKTAGKAPSPSLVYSMEGQAQQVLPGRMRSTASPCLH